MSNYTLLNDNHGLFEDEDNNEGSGEDDNEGSGEDDGLLDEGGDDGLLDEDDVGEDGLSDEMKAIHNYHISNTAHYGKILIKRYISGSFL